MGFYQEVIVESYVAEQTSGKHGKVHIRPIPGQPYPATMDVECSKNMRSDYPIGTKFKILVLLLTKKKKVAINFFIPVIGGSSRSLGNRDFFGALLNTTVAV